MTPTGDRRPTLADLSELHTQAVCITEYDDWLGTLDRHRPVRLTGYQVNDPDGVALVGIDADSAATMVLVKREALAQVLRKAGFEVPPPPPIGGKR